jgi:FAD/FMN-containing dehydrogenase
MIRWRDDLPDFSAIEGTVLPFGYGRSYGDSCLNNGGTLLDTTGLNQFIAFDAENGIIRCEAGVMLADILDVIVPRGWFLPVTPGTKYVSVAGAIANDVHGKNHHVAGTFGCHVTQFELLRSDGSRRICSPTENPDFFRATIGGLGLTGVILWAEFRLKKIPTPLIAQENIRFGSLDEFFDISAESEERGFEYTVSWVDCTAEGKDLGRGHFTRGNFYDPPLGVSKLPKPLPPIPVPIDAPTFLINTLTVKAFNNLYYHRQPWRMTHRIVHYNSFFYPLDTLTDWYRGYGKAGFLQYQFVMPYHDIEPIREVFRRIAHSGQGSPLVVFKIFGDIRSPGILSFPRPGVTLALDFAFRGDKTLHLLDELDQIVMGCGGALYPAKDARMSPQAFRASYPNWEEFMDYVDPKFSSSFWRRVMAVRD